MWETQRVKNVEGTQRVKNVEGTQRVIMWGNREGGLKMWREHRGLKILGTQRV